MTVDSSASSYLQQLVARYEIEPPRSLIKAAATADSPLSLLDLKNRFFLSWSERSLAGADFAQLAEWQTKFADVTIRRALELAWQELHGDTPLEGIFMLGLGKLGGRDLNLSSDVDLVAFYDKEMFPIPVHRGQSYEAGRVLKRMNAILQPRHSAEFVWRTDWRLRPEASVSGLAMEVEAAREFYFTRALPWHRLALIKARVVAGDVHAGSTFLDTLEPYLWRRNLDYGTLDELAGLKTRINLEHPGLRAERAQPEPIMSDPAGFNVKLGAGGIREIEFIANAAQLIWGGKVPELRTTNTLQALKEAGARGLIDAGETQRLAAIYERLRRLENAIQMRGNEHTHLIPDDAALEEVKALSGDDLDSLEADRRYVRSIFDAIFVDAADEVKELPRFVRTLQGESLKIAENWLGGFSRYGVRDGAPLAGLAEEILWRINGSGLEPSAAIADIDGFLGRVSRSAQYLRLLAEHPELVDPLLTPLLHSPHMASLLAMSPHIIDVFLQPTELDTGFIFATDDYERRLEGLRRFVNEQLYQAYYDLMLGRHDVTQLQSRLTVIAEAALDATLQVVADEMDMERLPVAVIGLGKVGTRRMMPLSDLDLLFLFPDEVESALASDIVRRLRTALTAKMSEGVVYDLDMRLRPSGRAGPPAVKWSQFVEHHDARARNWEHLALLTARAVAGDKALGERAEAHIASVLARPRDTDQFLADAARMWSRIADQRLRDTPHRLFDARLREGGLLEAEFVGNALRLLDRSVEDLASPTRYFSDQLVWERLLDLTLKADVPERFADRVPSGRTGVMATTVRTVTDALFGGVGVAGDDQAIIWKD